MQPIGKGRKKGMKVWKECWKEEIRESNNVWFPRIEHGCCTPAVKA